MNRQRFLTWVLAGMLIVLLEPAVDAGWWDSMSDAKPVKLEELLKDPHGWKGKEVSFICTFHKVSTLFNPYYTRFVPDEYVNFAVWPLTTKLWVKDQYLDSHKFVFLEKGHKQYEKLMELEKFTRLKLTGYVQSSFKSTPWIEIRHIEVLSGGISKGSLKYIILGDRAAARKNWQAALGYYNKAAAMTLPEEVMASVSKKRASTLHRMGRNEAARVALGPALAFNPDDVEAVALMDEMKKLAPAPAEKAEPLNTTEEEVVAKPVDPKKYPAEEPKAMPVPEEQPAVGEPVEMTPPPAEPEKKPVTVVVEEPVVEPEQPEKPVVEEPVEVPAVKDEPIKKKDAPKKRMSGPM